MNTAFQTLIGIASLTFLILPPVVGALRERRIDRRLRAAELGGARRAAARPGRASAPEREARATAPVPPQAAQCCPAEAA